MFACCAGRDGQEFVKCEYARLATHPAWFVDQRALSIQPCRNSDKFCYRWRGAEGVRKIQTFLSFMEFGWSWVIDTRFFSIFKRLATSLVNAFLSHNDLTIGRGLAGRSGRRVERLERSMVSMV